ncbi:hypothetical protein SAMN06265348_105105 [Pedobacter westerhofensis]|uniref:Lipoprotein n=1 Tax=Pedobacter westerhofensis TaxID=425512 RepID=A0A521D8K8_9SPHI|nr:hypothetical protein [Pedobacter westerhofensis]SMO68033.1 hypothetical protein SAMN06265348_105105 [Pedobacter westerhofensis]
MIKQTTLLLCLLLLTLVNFSCSKKRGLEPAIVIDEKNLTACPAGANCQYLFTEHADINPGPGTFVTGNYRIFWSSALNQGVSYTMYIKAPMMGTSFNLKRADIINGKIEVSRSCPACLFAASKLVDGYVKGINLLPGKPADQTKWILEAQIISESVYGSPAVRDTVFLKQYFYPNFVYN